MLVRRTIVTAMLASVVTGVRAAEEPTAPTIEAARWLAGRWIGGGDLGNAESCWSPPFAGHMVGHYTLRRGTRVIFYELMIFDEYDGGLRLNLKHFRPDFTAWEAPDQWQRFDPVSVTADELRVDGVTFRRLGPDQHSASVVHQDQTGAVSETTFAYRRAPL